MGWDLLPTSCETCWLRRLSGSVPYWTPGMERSPCRSVQTPAGRSVDSSGGLECRENLLSFMVGAAGLVQFSMPVDSGPSPPPQFTPLLRRSSPFINNFRNTHTHTHTTTEAEFTSSCSCTILLDLPRTHRSYSSGIEPDRKEDKSTWITEAVFMTSLLYKRLSSLPWKVRFR